MSESTPTTPSSATQLVRVLYRRHFMPLKDENQRSLDQLAPFGIAQAPAARVHMDQWGPMHRRYHSGLYRAAQTDRLIFGEEQLALICPLLDVRNVIIDPTLTKIYGKLTNNGRVSKVSELCEALDPMTADFLHRTTRYTVAQIAIATANDDPTRERSYVHISGHSPLAEIGVAPEKRSEFEIARPGDVIEYQVRVYRSETRVSAELFLEHFHRLR